MFDNLKSDFQKDLLKNKNFYSKSLLKEYTENFNIILNSNNIHNFIIDTVISEVDNNINLSFVSKSKEPVVINKIDIKGNSITKNKTIRSKISIEPGQYFNKYLFNKSVSNLERYPYIKNVNTEVVTNNQLADITIDIDEEIRTGNVLVAGTFNADTGAGLSFGIEDKNILVR